MALEGLRVLVVDDDADLLEPFALLLQVNGAEVGRATSVDEALDRLSGLHPDVVVTDLAMPRKDGFTLLRELRRRPDGRDVPVIAFTAYADFERARLAGAGFEAVIAKPGDPRTLIEAIEAAARH